VAFHPAPVSSFSFNRGGSWMLNLEGRELGGCKLIRKIGEGGMGEVYLAEQRKVGNRQVAVKVMRPDPGAYGAAAIEEAKRRFEREAATLGKLEHPNILPIYDTGVEEDLYYIIMQYAADGSLADCIRGRSRRTLTLPLGVGSAVDFISQVASALQFTHEKGIVHRDVKPANVLTQEPSGGGWRMLLADFGVARGLDNTSQRTQVTGTFTYMAPEQFQGEFSPATDQYALAIMTFQLLAGRPPFEGELGAVMRAHMSERPPSLRALNPAVPAAVEAAVMRGLAKEPDQRHPSVLAFAQALKAGLSDPVGPPPLPTTVAPPPIISAGPVVLAGAQPHWPSGAPAKSPDQKPPARPSGLGRVWLVTLAAAVLVVAIVGTGLYANSQNQANAHAHATETAQARATETAGAPTATSPQQTVTVTVTGTVPVITLSPLPPVAPPTLPPNAGSQVFDSPAPLCDSGDSIQWTTGTDAQTTCPGGSITGLVSLAPQTLACINAQGVQQANGYMFAKVTSQSGQVALGFRQGAGDSVGSGFKTTGYYIAVDAQSGHYVLYSVDHAGATSKLQEGSLAARLPPTFYISALFDSSTLTMTINGQTLPSVNDSAFANGWVAACTTGSATFSHIQLYNLTQ
jgi:serine/threonine protein kinase